MNNIFFESITLDGGAVVSARRYCCTLTKVLGSNPDQRFFQSLVERTFPNVQEYFVDLPLYLLSASLYTKGIRLLIHQKNFFVQFSTTYYLFLRKDAEITKNLSKFLTKKIHITRLVIFSSTPFRVLNFLSQLNRISIISLKVRVAATAPQPS